MLQFREKGDEGTGNRQQGTEIAAAAYTVGVANDRPPYTDMICTAWRAANRRPYGVACFCFVTYL